MHSLVIQLLSNHLDRLALQFEELERAAAENKLTARTHFSQQCQTINDLIGQISVQKFSSDQFEHLQNVCIKAQEMKGKLANLQNSLPQDQEVQPVQSPLRKLLSVLSSVKLVSSDIGLDVEKLSAAVATLVRDHERSRHAGVTGMVQRKVPAPIAHSRRAFAAMVVRNIDEVEVQRCVPHYLRTMLHSAVTEKQRKIRD